MELRFEPAAMYQLGSSALEHKAQDYYPDARPAESRHSLSGADCAIRLSVPHMGRINAKQARALLHTAAWLQCHTSAQWAEDLQLVYSPILYPCCIF